MQRCWRSLDSWLLHGVPLSHGRTFIALDWSMLPSRACWSSRASCTHLSRSFSTDSCRFHAECVCGWLGGWVMMVGLGGERGKGGRGERGEKGGHHTMLLRHGTDARMGPRTPARVRAHLLELGLAEQVFKFSHTSTCSPVRRLRCFKVVVKILYFDSRLMRRPATLFAQHGQLCSAQFQCSCQLLNLILRRAELGCSVAKPFACCLEVFRLRRAASNRGKACR